MRQQHYRFSHEVMVKHVLDDPMKWMAQAQTYGPQMIHNAWTMAGEGLAPQDRVDGSVPTLEPITRGPQLRGYLVTLPAPQATGECYFLAVAAAGNNQPRYFAAERGNDGGDGTPRAFLAEWKASATGRMRVHNSDLPQISKAAFIEAVAASAMAPPVEAAPKKKKANVPLLIGCGCAVPLAFGIIVGSCLFYYESILETYDPTSEVVSVPIHPNQPAKFEFKWDGHGYAFNNFWLVVENGTKENKEFTFSGNISCTPSPSYKTFETSLSYGKTYHVKEIDKDGFSAWIYLNDHYAKSASEPMKCTATIKPSKGTWTTARIVVTQRQRPSDWL
ncbi:MAG TPA: hypothetical protein PKL73_14850 [Polyangiaceae bacterium]|nr:hypothetical protein [Polyangiaceae bacterium]